MQQNNNYATTEQYLAKVAQCRKENKTLIVAFSAEYCMPCKALERLAKGRSDVEYIKLRTNSETAQKYKKFYAEQGAQDINLIPDWLLVRYENDKIVYAKRYLGAPYPRQLDQFIFTAKSTRKVTYRHNQ